MASNLGTIKLGLLMTVEDGSPVHIGDIEVPIKAGTVKRREDGTAYADVVLDWTGFMDRMTEFSQFVVLALAKTVGNDTARDNE
jgi:hypothetical protein